MKILTSIIKFFGGISFAIILITAVALFTIAGTIIESKTGSHQSAALFTYSNPIFKALLWGFFVNILVSALRRWPFRKKHIPFLSTHLGLLMILGGTLIKSYWGIQGSMIILEGAATQELLLLDSYAIQLERKDPINAGKIIKQALSIDGEASELDYEKIKIERAAYYPHSKPNLETWFNGDRLLIKGLPAFAIHDWQDFSTAVPISGSCAISSKDKFWNIVACRVPNVNEAAKTIYLEGLSVTITDLTSEQIIYTGTLAEAPKSILFDLHLDQAALLTAIGSKKIITWLNGLSSLLNLNAQGKLAGAYAIDLHRKPTLAFLQDDQGDIALYAFDASGRVHTEHFAKNSQGKFISYDGGFGGYTVQANIPFKMQSRQDYEKAILTNLESQVANAGRLAPPLELFREACKFKGKDFGSCLINYLNLWFKKGTLLFPSDIKLQFDLDISWKTMSAAKRRALDWIIILADSLDPHLKAGLSFRNILEKYHYPFLKAINIENGSNEDLFTVISQQIWAWSEQLPEPNILTFNSDARLLSAYMIAFNINLASIVNFELLEQMNFKNTENIILECPLTQTCQPAAPLRKWEDNIPSLNLRVKHNDQEEYVSLAYDRYAQGLKWPILGGKYLIRFQPLSAVIPYKIRLRHAKKISYPNSQQPYSYESDLIVTDVRTGVEQEVKLSMNQVYETDEHYRFYLANINPQNELTAKRVQLIVNHDPGKYYLTYPGAIILVLGIILLFWGFGK